MTAETIVEAMRDGLLLRYIFINGTPAQHREAISSVGAIAIEATDTFKLQSSGITIQMRFLPQIKRRATPMTTKEVEEDTRKKKALSIDYFMNL